MESIYLQVERTKHRALGLFLVVAAWKAGADCVVLEYEDLRKYLGLAKIKEARVDWLCQDLAEWFPYSERFYLNANSLDSCPRACREARPVRSRSLGNRADAIQGVCHTRLLLDRLL